MVAIALDLAFLAVSLSLLLNLYRLAIGPDIADRLLAMDTLTVNAVALIVLLGIAFGSALYFEAALVLAMFGFVATVAFCKFLLRGDVIE